MCGVHAISLSALESTCSATLNSVQISNFVLLKAKVKQRYFAVCNKSMVRSVWEGCNADIGFSSSAVGTWPCPSKMLQEVDVRGLPRQKRTLKKCAGMWRRTGGFPYPYCHISWASPVGVFTPSCTKICRRRWQPSLCPGFSLQNNVQLESGFVDKMCRSSTPILASSAALWPVMSPVSTPSNPRRRMPPNSGWLRVNKYPRRQSIIQPSSPQCWLPSLTFMVGSTMNLCPNENVSPQRATPKPWPAWENSCARNALKHGSPMNTGFCTTMQLSTPQATQSQAWWKQTWERLLTHHTALIWPLVIFGYSLTSRSSSKEECSRGFWRCRKQLSRSSTPCNLRILRLPSTDSSYAGASALLQMATILKETTSLQWIWRKSLPVTLRKTDSSVWHVWTNTRDRKFLWSPLNQPHAGICLLLFCANHAWHWTHLLLFLKLTNLLTYLQNENIAKLTGLSVIVLCRNLFEIASYKLTNPSHGGLGKSEKLVCSYVSEPGSDTFLTSWCVQSLLSHAHKRSAVRSGRVGTIGTEDFKHNWARFIKWTWHNRAKDKQWVLNLEINSIFFVHRKQRVGKQCTQVDTFCTWNTATVVNIFLLNGKKNTPGVIHNVKHQNWCTQKKINETHFSNNKSTKRRKVLLNERRLPKQHWSRDYMPTSFLVSCGPKRPAEHSFLHFTP